MALPSSDVDSRIDEERFSSLGGWWWGVVGAVVRRGLERRGGGGGAATGVDERTSWRRWCADEVISGSGRS